MKITITAARKRLPPPAQLPDLINERAEAKAFFSGWWHALPLGMVIGAGVAIIVVRGVA